MRAIHVQFGTMRSLQGGVACACDKRHTDVKAARLPPAVIASHSRSQNGVASLAYGEAIQRARSAPNKKRGIREA
jgi:hypothetical protein